MEKQNVQKSLEDMSPYKKRKAKIRRIEPMETTKINERFILEHDLQEVEKLYQESEFIANRASFLRRKILFLQVVTFLAFLIFYLVSLFFSPIIEVDELKRGFFECFWIVLLVEIIISVIEMFLLMKPKKSYLKLTKKIDDILKPFGFRFYDWVEYRDPRLCKKVRWRRHYRHFN